MRIKRLIYLIFTIIGLIFLTTLFIITNFDFICIVCMFLILLPNKYLQKRELMITNDIIMRYGFNCDPNAYINEMKEYAKKCILSKRHKISYTMYYVFAYIDMGEFTIAKDLLLSIDDEQTKMDIITRVLYYKGWCDYFYFNGYDEKMKITLLKMKDIINNTKNQMLKNNFSIVYTTLEAKYYVLTGTNLNKAKDIFNRRKKVIPSLLITLSTDYLLAIIDLKEKNFKEAIAKLKVLANKEKNLYVCINAQKLLDQINL